MKLHYRGDVRHADTLVYDTPRHGAVIPVSASYDEETDLTTVEFAKLTDLPAVEKP